MGSGCFQGKKSSNDDSIKSIKDQVSQKTEIFTKNENKPKVDKQYSDDNNKEKKKEINHKIKEKGEKSDKIEKIDNQKVEISKEIKKIEKKKEKKDKKPVDSMSFHSSCSDD